MTEKDLWCLDCGVSVGEWIGKGDVLFVYAFDVMDRLRTFLLAHETTNTATHRLVYLATSDVDAVRIQCPITAAVAAAIDR